MTRLLVCDDSAASRRLIRSLVQPHLGIEVVGEAGSGREAIELAARLQPDVVLMDVRMPGLGGIDATRRLKELLPATLIVAFAASKDESDIRAVIDVGASAYCVKGCSAWECSRVTGCRSSARTTSAGTAGANPTGCAGRRSPSAAASSRWRTRSTR